MRQQRIGRRDFARGITLVPFLATIAGCSSSGDSGANGGLGSSGGGSGSGGSSGGPHDGADSGPTVTGGGEAGADGTSGSPGDGGSSGGYYTGPFMVSCNAYSFNDELVAGTLDLMALLDWCAMPANKFDGLDATGYYFDPANHPSSNYLAPWVAPPDAWLAMFKQHAMDVGVPITGTGIQNDFANPAYQQAGLDRFTLWCDVANKIGASKIRIFSGSLPPPPMTRTDWLQGLIDTLGKCAMIAKTNGVKVSVQNHGDMISSADEFVAVLTAVNMPDVLGADDDTGYFLEGGDVCTPNPGGQKGCMSCNQVSVDPKYAAIGRMLPYAFNMQIKSSITPVKYCAPTPMDLNRLMTVIRNGPYRDALPIESLKPGYPGAPTYDAPTVTAAFLQQVHAALAATASGPVVDP